MFYYTLLYSWNVWSLKMFYMFIFKSNQQVKVVGRIAFMKVVTEKLKFNILMKTLFCLFLLRPDILLFIKVYHFMVFSLFVTVLCPLVSSLEGYYSLPSYCVFLCPPWNCFLSGCTIWSTLFLCKIYYEFSWK